MAHTEKQADERRPDLGQFPVGTWVGMNIIDASGKPHVAFGKIAKHDPGGWAYVGGWKNNHGVSLSTFFRTTNCFKLEAPPAVEWDADVLAAIKKGLQDHHDSKTLLPQRWGIYCAGQWCAHNGGCFNSMGSYFQHGSDALAIAFHGDGADLTFDQVKDNNAYNEAMKNYKRGQNTFEGTARSRKWVEFLMSDKSPWRALHKYIVEKDLDYINNAGFIFETPGELPVKLTYNFALAVRYPWELPRNYSLWLMLVEKGIDPVKALFLTNFIAPKPEAKDINGPYETIYPWSFLESARLDCAKKFINGTPGNLQPYSGNCYHNPNVFPLWQTKGENATLFQKMLKHKDMMLEDAIRYVDQAVAGEEQVAVDF